ncbi:MAG: hypothetical protein IJ864_02640 [Alphaproteobacteria bacterium]|nr:hypothetical protein [Alphaproteobacteria bacterium]
MICTEQEITGMILSAQVDKLELVMRKLDSSWYDFLFENEHFALLWSMIGMVSLKGASVPVREKIWRKLLENGVVKAFNNHFLQKFSMQLAENGNVPSSVWTELDEAKCEVKFQQIILDELLETNVYLGNEIFSVGFNGQGLIDKLTEIPLNDAIEAYLVHLFNDDNCLERNKILHQLTTILVYANRSLSNREKKYFSYYFQEFVKRERNSYKKIGLDDRLWARLIAGGRISDLSKTDQPVAQAHNQEIIDFVRQFEEDEGFYDETAARWVEFEQVHLLEAKERCLWLINQSNHPRGILLALAALNLEQVGVAAEILFHLAQKGRATEMIGFLHRILACRLVQSRQVTTLLKCNLRAFRIIQKSNINNSLKEYISRRYLQAIHIFLLRDQINDGFEILKALVMGEWIDEQSVLVEEVAKIILEMEQRSSVLHSKLIYLSSKLKLNIFDEKNDEDVPLDVAYELENEWANNINLDSFSALLSEPKIVAADSSLIASEAGTGILNTDVPIAEGKDNKIIDNMEIDAKNNPLHDDENNVLQKSVEELELQIPVVEIQQWTDEKDESQSDDKFSINSILNINPNEVDKHFEKIKQLADSAIKNAEEKAAQILRKNNVVGITLNKLRQLADKFKKKY